MKIREASIEDAPLIARITVDTWKTAYRGLIDQEYLDNLSYESREQGWREFPFATSFIYAAENEIGDIVGFAAAGPERESNPLYRGELYAIYVYHNFQCKGIGSALFKAVLRRFRQCDINSLMLWVLTDSPYRRFYDQLGGEVLESKTLDMDWLTSEITAYGWLNI